jgi:hypothetical protein
MSVISRIAEAIASDDDDQSERLVNDYNHATKEQQQAIDDALICICGWSLSTLIKQAKHD